MVRWLRTLLIAALVLNGPGGARAFSMAGHSEVPGQGVAAHHAPDSGLQQVPNDVDTGHEHCRTLETDGSQHVPPDQRVPAGGVHDCGGSECHCGCAGPLALTVSVLCHYSAFEQASIVSPDDARLASVRAAPPFRPPTV